MYFLCSLLYHVLTGGPVLLFFRVGGVGGVWAVVVLSLPCSHRARRRITIHLFLPAGLVFLSFDCDGSLVSRVPSSLP